MSFFNKLAGDPERRARRDEAATKRKEATATKRKAQAEREAAKTDRYRSDTKKLGEGKPLHGITFGVFRRSGAVRSDSQSVVVKNQDTILRDFNPSEYGTKTRKEAFVRSIDDLRRPYNGHTPTTRQAMSELLNSPICEFTYHGRAKYLSKIGLKDDPDKKEMSDPEMKKANDLYEQIMIRDGVALYEEIAATEKKKAGKKR